MPVTRREQDPADASARGEALSEPPLHRLRGSLVGTRFELLKNAAFSAVFTVSLGMIAGGAGLLQPDNQFYADARAALKGLTGAAASSAESVSSSVQIATASASQRVSRSVSGLIGDHRDAGAAQSPSSAAATSANAPSHSAAPGAAALAMASERQHIAKIKARHRKSPAHHRHRAAEQPAAATASAPAQPQQAAAWSFDRFTDGLGDELAKAYYGVVNFVAGGFPAAISSARSGLNSAMGMIGVDTEPTDFDPSRPETLLQAMTSTSTLIMMVGIVLFLIIVGVFVVSVKDSLRNASRRLRTKRSTGYA